MNYNEYFRKIMQLGYEVGRGTEKPFEKVFGTLNDKWDKSYGDGNDCHKGPESGCECPECKEALLENFLD